MHTDMVVIFKLKMTRELSHLPSRNAVQWISDEINDEMIEIDDVNYCMPIM